MATHSIKVNMTPSHPGDFIRTEVIEELGLNVTKAAEILGVRRATLSDLLNGNAALSPEMALRIEKAFDVSMDMLLRMQAWYDASQMRARANEVRVRRYVSGLTGNCFPVIGDTVCATGLQAVRPNVSAWPAAARPRRRWTCAIGSRLPSRRGLYRPNRSRYFRYRPLNLTCAKISSTDGSI